jgi:hypothetical protein
LIYNKAALENSKKICLVEQQPSWLEVQGCRTQSRTIPANFCLIWLDGFREDLNVIY